MYLDSTKEMPWKGKSNQDWPIILRPKGRNSRASHQMKLTGKKERKTLHEEITRTTSPPKNKSPRTEKK